MKTILLFKRLLERSGSSEKDWNFRVSARMKKCWPTIFTGLLSLFGSHAFSQHEYLATVDPSTGKYVKLDSIPGVRYMLLSEFTTLNKIDNRVAFVGSSSQTQFNLLILNICLCSGC